MRTPKFLFVPALCLLLFPVLAQASGWSRQGGAWSRIVEHKNGSHTYSKQDITTKTLTEWTKDPAGILTKKRLFSLDKRSRPRLAYLYDGRENLLARTEYLYDEYDELKEERLYNTRGQLLRRLIYGLQNGGIRSVPVAFTYDPENPDAKPVRSTERVEPIMPIDVHGGSGGGIPGAPKITSQQVAPASSPPVKATKKKKRGFLGLFKKNR